MTIYATGDDGYYRYGCAPAVSVTTTFKRSSLTWSGTAGSGFVDNGDGTVTDTLTGLIWLKNANCFGTRNWVTAVGDANTLSSGSCGLTDGSTAGQWRMPNINELRSLHDPTQVFPSLPAGHPFFNIVDSLYWSSSRNNSTGAKTFHFDPTWGPSDTLITASYYLWPVRGGQ
jgi:hypothetical protein